jgi:glycosyltransferase involved in cell wall biosynthesis
MAVRVCLSMIVRNESKVITRCLDAARPVIDAVSICDTGSTDDTIAVIDAWLRRTGIPGRIHQQRFLDFGRSRTRALRAAQATVRELGWKPSQSWLLFLDADMVLQVGDTFSRDALEADVYRVVQRCGSLIYPNVRLMKARVRGRFVGSTHEYFSTPAGSVEASLPSLSIDDRHDGGHRSDKFQRDRRLLERELARDPGNTRALFYLAETYRGLRELPKALALYRRRAEAGGWEEEAWYAQYVAALLLREAGRPRQAWRALAAVVRRDPKRHEPYALLAGLLREQGHHTWACRLARRGLQMGVPADRSLFLDREMYDWAFLRELSISAYYTGARQEGLEANERLLLGRGAPWHITSLAVQNSAHYAAPLPTAELVPLTPTVPVAFAPCNPSVLRTDEGYLVNCRAVSYRITPDQGYIAWEPDGVLRSRNVLMRFDRDLRALGETEVRADLPPVRWHPVQGLEDARVFTHCGRTGFLCTTADLHPDGPIRVSLCLVTANGEVDHHRPLTGHGDDRAQKNWLPFVVGDELFAIYSYEPLVIVKIDVDTGQVAPVVEQPQGRSFGDWRGSAGPVDLPARLGGGRLVLIHAVSSHPRRCYTHRFVRLDDDWRITHASRPFVFHETGIEFGSGMCLTHDNDHLLITYGVEDREAWLCRVPLDDVSGLLMDLPDWPPAA